MRLRYCREGPRSLVLIANAEDQHDDRGLVEIDEASIDDSRALAELTVLLPLGYSELLWP